MAINKRKVLDAARKFAQKGAKQKALKEYDKLIKADPRDTKLLLEVGDAYRRWGQVEEAVAQYSKVSNQYKQDGFDARAVAVLKQILNLDPKHYAAHVSLSELYQRMGLEGEAVSALQTAADGFYREGRRHEALDLLRKMAALDPSNTTNRLKVAELLRQENMPEDAIAEYEAVVAELVRQGVNEQVAVVRERMLEVDPGRVDLMIALAQELSDQGQPQRAEVFAVRALDAAPEPENYERLCGIYKALGDDTKLADTTRALAQLYRDRGDETRAREVIQRLPSDDVLVATGGLHDDRSELEEEPLMDDELLDDDDFLETDDDQLDTDFSLEAKPEPKPEARSTTKPDAKPSAAAPAAEVPLPEGDTEQLFAEATVYLRYGKRDQAIASLKAILLQEPAHIAALEKLGEAEAEVGNEIESIAYFSQAADVARQAGDATSWKILHDRIAGIDAAAAARLEPMSEPEPVVEDDGEFEIDLDDDLAEADDTPATGAVAGSAAEPTLDEGLDLGTDVAVDLAAARPSAEAEQATDGFDFDVDIDLDDGTEGLSGTLPEVPEPTSSGAELDIDLAAGDTDLGEDAFEIDVDVDSPPSPEPDETPPAALDEGLDLDLGLDDEPATGQSAAVGGQSSTTAARIDEELEEADFYVQQGLAEEAMAIYRRILQVAPSHPTAMLRMGELEAQQGPSASASQGLRVETQEEDGEGDGEFDLGAEVEAEFDAAPVQTVKVRSAPQRTEPVAPPARAEVVEDAGEDATEVAMAAAQDSAADGMFEREPVMAEPEMSFPDGGGLDVQAEDTLPLAPSDAVRSETAEGVAASADDGDAGFDLGEALADVMADDPPAAAQDDPNATSSVLSSVDVGFESIFADFKKGVSATLEEGDYETRYDLGIAYREMGLHDDAVAEFMVCLQSETKRFESLIMLGLCTLDASRFEESVNHFQQALSTENIPVDRQAGLYFDLGRAYIGLADLARARSAFEKVQQLEPGFPGVEQMLSELAQETEAPMALQAQDAGGFESFDDVMSGFDDEEVEAEAVPEETFESFDDVITDVEAVIDEPEVEDDPGATGSGERTGKRKKISFV